MYSQDGGPVRISVEYNYFGDGEFSFDEDIVRRMCWIDPKFVPVFKREVWRYATGGTKVFKHFGFGVAHEPNTPIVDKAVYAGLKPRMGFLATLARSLGVSIWAQGPPFADESPEDGTPGETVPFDERAYAHAIACDAEMRRLYAKAPSGDEGSVKDVPDELRQFATKAYREHFKEAEAAEDKSVDLEETDLRDFLGANRRRLRNYFDLSEYDRQGIGFVSNDRNPKKAVHFNFSPPVRPAGPGSRLVVPV